MMQHHSCFPLWRLNCFLLVLVSAVRYSAGIVRSAPVPPVLQDCYNRYAHQSLRNVVGHAAAWSCEGPIVGGMQTFTKPSRNSPSTAAHLNSLIQQVKRIISGEGGPTAKCRRKEYRMLTDEERKAFHDGINAIKNHDDMYDAIARLHSGAVLPSAHNGPNFLPWHRVYLLLLETELQSINPSICLPYWDSSLDSELPQPKRSYVFSPEFLGGRGSTGPVQDGPFAGWKTDFGPLRREIGDMGDLYTKGEIANILAQTRTWEITRPNGRDENGLEFHHNDVHNYIGGQMSELPSAAHDPAFFLHHCFVDYLWEVFRTQQRTAGIDPQTDYPQDYGSEFHAPGRRMDGFNWTITALDGYSDNLTRTYVYDPSPSCSRFRPSCGSKYLQCNMMTGRCVPTDPTTRGQGCPSLQSIAPKGIQNSFCIDGLCDSRGWVFLPVEVVSKRSPYLAAYNSYPVFVGNISKTFDIYQPAGYQSINQTFPPTNPKGYDKCDDGNGIGRIYIQAQGLNYEGSYKESVVIDQRLATSISIGYLAVKDPQNQPVTALFRAFDSCGRICNTACRIPDTPIFQSCGGVLDIENLRGTPRQYSSNYGDATLKTWGYQSNQRTPSFIDKDIVLSFYCDFGEDLPWADKSIPPPPPPEVPNECEIDKDCIIDVPCSTKDTCSGERYACRGRCNAYVDCSVGTFWKSECPFGWNYDRFRYQCSYYAECNPASNMVTQ